MSGKLVDVPIAAAATATGKDELAQVKLQTLQPTKATEERVGHSFREIVHRCC